MNELVDENTIIDRYTRSRIIFGENFERIQNTKVVVFGVGGVGVL